ncbi:3-methyladenine DNA glycosylase [Isoptericola sp. NPDC056618]|uniref:3-methyladenine DNA glycosylase n=1 Tax=unclassified Isoptericola TaxID=2623355 RepID=UPI003651D99F
MRATTLDDPAAPADAVVPRDAWEPRAAAHAARADGLTAVWREARDRGAKHAIEDFLFTYYPTRVSHLRRWHPGPGVVLAGAAEHAGWRWYREVGLPGEGGAARGAGATLDVDAFVADRGDTVRYVRALVSATAGRPGTFGCFGLHEWAMVYRDRAAGRDHRHPLPLRLGHDGTDAVVESHRIGCSHFDAYRFFTPEAADRNQLRPTRERQPAMEQPGCLHAGMDLNPEFADTGDVLHLTRETQLAYEQPGCLHAAMDCYKWALKLGPAVPGDLLLDAFELAREIRYTDMAASPYDVSSYDIKPVRIETPEGKAEYVRRQRDYAERSNALRHRIVAVCDALLAHDSRAGRQPG